jgi:hypothetical protein
VWQVWLYQNTAFLFKKKCTLVQAVRLCTDHTAHMGSRSIALLFHSHGTRRGWGVSVTPRPLFTPGKDPVPLVQEAGWAPGLVWTSAENLAPMGFNPRTVQPIASCYTNYATRPICSFVPFTIKVNHRWCWTASQNKVPEMLPWWWRQWTQCIRSKGDYFEGDNTNPQPRYA